jgi:poly(A) polymerase
MNERRPEIFATTDLHAGLCPILPTAIDRDAQAVLRRLHQAGHKAYLVGGCVRDLLLGGTPKDFDVATSARPRQVKKLFRNARIIGRRFRLVHVLFGRDKQIEVSTFRRDPNDGDGGGPEPEADESRHDFSDEPLEAVVDDPVVDAHAAPPLPAPHSGESRRHADRAEDEDEDEEDLLIREDNVYGTEDEDAVRRDFTINGLFYDVETQSVLDYVGGVADLEKRTLRTIGEPARRLREDPVRILRAVKFSTRLGLALDPLLASAMAEYHEDLGKSAPPRVFEEVLRMLGGPAPQRSMEVLVGLGVARVLFPELGLRHGDDGDPRLPRLLARLAALGELDRGRRSFPTATYLAVLFYDELLERLKESEAPGPGPRRPPSQALDDFLRPIGMRCRMARRDTARTRAMFLALRRIDPELDVPHGKKRRRRGGLAEFVRREFFDDALVLLRVVCAAEQRDLSIVDEWEHRRDELASGRHVHDDPPHGPRSAHEPHLHGSHSHSHEPAHGPDDRHHAHEPRQAPSDGAIEDVPGRRRRRRRRRRGGGGGAAAPLDLPSSEGPDDEPS